MYMYVHAPVEMHYLEDREHKDIPPPPPPPPGLEVASREYSCTCTCTCTYIIENNIQVLE